VKSEPQLHLVDTTKTATVTLVDSCVLLDIATDDPIWAQWSDGALAGAFDTGRVVINPVVYAEVSVGYDTIEALDDALPVDDYHREPLPYEAGFLAGKAFLAYRKRGGQKRSPLPDFYIGAHASIKSYRLLTRDPKRYRTYFPGLHVVAPA
jgi:predicted nucleic acid-binding protein